MVVKFWANNGLSAIDYLLNHRVNDGTSRVLSGNEMLTRRIIENMSQKNKATVGVLSFHENDNITEEQKKEIMDSFETAIFSGVPKDQTNILWVEHSDKSRTELNFVIPKVNLVTNKSINWALDKYDRDFFNSWRDVINHQYNLENPNDLTKKRNFKHSKNLKINTKYEEINSTLHEMVADGSIRNRDELLNILKQAGLEIHRTGKDYISIQSKEMKKAKRFTGEIYSERFTELKAITTAIQEYERTRISGAKQGSTISSKDELEQRYNKLQRSRKQRFVEVRANNRATTKDHNEPSRNNKSIYSLANQNIERAESKRRENRVIREQNKEYERELQRGFLQHLDCDDCDDNIHSSIDIQTILTTSKYFTNREDLEDFLEEIIDYDNNFNSEEIDKLFEEYNDNIDRIANQRNALNEIHERNYDIDEEIKNRSSGGYYSVGDTIRLGRKMAYEVKTHNEINEKIKRKIRL